VAGRTQKGAAEKLRALHAAGVLMLPNARDAGSAAMIALAGAQAIATTSGGGRERVRRVGGTRLQQQDRPRGVLAQAGRQDRAGGATPDDDHVSGLGQVGHTSAVVSERRDPSPCL
jgi:hypothetical protein